MNSILESRSNTIWVLRLQTHTKYIRIHTHTNTTSGISTSDGTERKLLVFPSIYKTTHNSFLSFTYIVYEKYFEPIKWKRTNLTPTISTSPLITPFVPSLERWFVSTYRTCEVEMTYRSGVKVIFSVVGSDTLSESTVLTFMSISPELTCQVRGSFFTTPLHYLLPLPFLFLNISGRQILSLYTED